MKKLYFYKENIYYGEIRFFIKLSDEELERLMSVDIWWFDKAGKHSEGLYDFKNCLKLVTDMNIVNSLECLSDYIDVMNFEEDFLEMVECEEGTDQW